MTPLLELDAVDKRFVATGTDVTVLQRFSMAVMPGEFVGILGPSGSGKTTVLRLIAGLEKADRGEVRFEGQPIGGTPPGLGYLFQSYDSFPWKTVAGNVEAALLNSGLSAQERRERALSAIDQVGLRGFERSYPHELSGGMRQRAALARTLLTASKVLLLDEPFGALDVRMRVELQRLVWALFEERRNTSVVLVTHDVPEAVRLSTRIIVLSQRPAKVLLDTFTKRRDANAPSEHDLISLCGQKLAVGLPDEPTAPASCNSE